MQTDFVSKSEVLIHAPRARVWQALVDPEIATLYLFGATIETDWSIGGPISWKGEWDGRAYEDNGIVLRFEPEDTLQFTHAGGASPDHVHTVTIGLGEQDGATRVTLVQDGNDNADEMEQAGRSWQGVLGGLKLLVERDG
jgi:uncharacterized protein YndB with AHSA1/START domain